MQQSGDAFLLEVPIKMYLLHYRNSSRRLRPTLILSQRVGSWLILLNCRRLKKELCLSLWSTSVHGKFVAQTRHSNKIADVKPYRVIKGKVMNIKKDKEAHHQILQNPHLKRKLNLNSFQHRGRRVPSLQKTGEQCNKTDAQFKRP